MNVPVKRQFLGMKCHTDLNISVSDKEHSQNQEDEEKNTQKDRKTIVKYTLQKCKFDYFCMCIVRILVCVCVGGGGGCQIY